VKAYFISGLGADRRAFYRIQLPGNYEAVYLDWIPPSENESLPDYAKRFSNFINTAEPFILIGLSFGGMLASEIARLTKPQKLIIISSVANANELPWYFRLAGRLKIQQLIPMSFYKKMTLLNSMINPRTEEEKTMIREYIMAMDDSFIEWSINAIITWDNGFRYPDLVHIHGASDRLLPSRFVHADYLVKNGGHLMVWNKAEEVNKIIVEELEGRV
jgi:pimeloyl-ACP methyl ester carboxylesterase